MANETAPVLYIVRTWVPEDQLEEWNRWHNEVHVPDVAAQPYVRSARKYRVIEDNMPAEWQPQYMTVYEFDSVEDCTAYRTSAAGLRLRDDYAAKYGAVGKISRQVLEPVAEF